MFGFDRRLSGVLVREAGGPGEVVVNGDFSRRAIASGDEGVRHAPMQVAQTFAGRRLDQHFGDALVREAVSTGATIGFRRRDCAREAALVVAGAVVAMIAVLLTVGAGNLFPIVIVFAIAIIGGATAAGTAIATELRPDEPRDGASH